MVLGSSPVAGTSPSDFAPDSSKEFLDIQAAIECGFALKRVRDMARTYSHIVLRYFDISISGKLLNDLFRRYTHYSLVKNNTSFKSDSDFCIILIHATSEKCESFKTGLIVLHSIF